VEYRCQTNEEIFWDAGHTNGRSHMGGIGQRKEIKNRNEYRNLKLPGATMGRGLGKSEKD
jgi:hypothetical protein